MAAIQITKDVVSVGVLNPNLRVFDIVMKTDYGTTYNAYLVKGSEKTALIETTHRRFFEPFVENVTAAGCEKIDYIVLNHTEPDHSGALAALLERYPEAELVCSKAAGIYLKNITNKALKIHAVKDGEELSLGDKTLRFLIAPFLHWPDSMFTYCPEEQVLFTCDFLGSHYCEPRMLSPHVSYPNAYDAAFEGYYRAIFGPFPDYVLKGLDQIKELAAQFVCPSHGPVLVGDDIEKAKALYRRWSIPQVRENQIIALFYASAYGCTTALAEQLQAGIQSVLPDAEVSRYDLTGVSLEEAAEKLNGADAFLLGSPTINKNAVPPVWDLLARADAIHAPAQTAAAFGSYGWSGEAVPALTNRLREMKFKVPADGLKVCFVPSQEELQAAYAYGAEFAKALV